MGFAFQLGDYERYQARVGAATTVDASRRTDPARVERVWANLQAIHETYGAPWVVQLWTKDLGEALARGEPLLRRLAAEGTGLAVQLTATGLAGSVWEPLGCEPFSGVERFARLAGSMDHVKWRFDPIIPGVHRLERFRALAARAADLGIARCVINFISPPGRYRRADARLAPALSGWAQGMPGFDEDWKVKAAGEIVQVARELGIRVAACAESASLCARVPGLDAASCGDAAWFARLSKRQARAAKGRGSRGGCGCAPYFDAGIYGQWKACHRCLYCYAG